jgi:hypothetical protein
MSLFRIVKAELDKADIECLLALGCPSDEYSLEASRIEDPVSKMTGSRELSQGQLEKIIQNVWNEMFGPFDSKQIQARAAGFKLLAEHIWKQVQHA